MSKISELKNQVPVKISNLNNYSAVCCRNGKGTTIVFFFLVIPTKEKEGNIHKSLGDRYRGRHYLNRIAILKLPSALTQNPWLGKLCLASKYTAAFLRGCDKWEAIGGGGGILYKLFRKGTLRRQCLMQTLSLKITKPPP